MAAVKKIHTLADVRAWAAQTGLAVGQRGRVATAVIEAFNKAHRKNPYAIA